MKDFTPLGSLIERSARLYAEPKKANLLNNSFLGVKLYSSRGYQVISMNEHNPESDLITIRAIAALGVRVPPHERSEQVVRVEYSNKLLAVLALGATGGLGAVGFVTYKLEWDSAVNHSPLRQPINAHFEPAPTPVIEDATTPIAPSTTAGPSSITLSPIFSPKPQR